MIENLLFCFAFALQIFAWFLAGGKIGFRPRHSGSGEGRTNTHSAQKTVWYNSLLLRRVYLCIGAAITAIYAYSQHDYILLAGQGALFVILWFRVSLTRE